MKKLGTFAGFYVVCLILIYVFLFVLEALSQHGAGILILPVPLALLVWALFELLCRSERLEPRMDEPGGQHAAEKTGVSCDKKILQ